MKNKSTKKEKTMQKNGMSKIFEVISLNFEIDFKFIFFSSVVLNGFE